MMFMMVDKTGDIRDGNSKANSRRAKSGAPPPLSTVNAIPAEQHKICPPKMTVCQLKISFGKHSITRFASPANNRSFPC